MTLYIYFFAFLEVVREVLASTLTLGLLGLGLGLGVGLEGGRVFLFMLATSELG